MALFNPEQTPRLQLERQSQQSDLPSLSPPFDIACCILVPAHCLPYLYLIFENTAT